MLVRIRSLMVSHPSPPTLSAEVRPPLPQVREFDLGKPTPHEDVPMPPMSTGMQLRHRQVVTAQPQQLAVIVEEVLEVAKRAVVVVDALSRKGERDHVREGAPAVSTLVVLSTGYAL